MSEEVKERRKNLEGELTEASRREFGLAKSAYIWSQGLFILALLCSVAAVAIGLFLPVSAKVVSGIAALPPLISYMAVSFRVETRQNWYFRKAVALETLRSQLLYQLREEPTAEDVAGIAAERDKVVRDMQREWYETITKNFLEFTAQKTPKPPLG